MYLAGSLNQLLFECVVLTLLAISKASEYIPRTPALVPNRRAVFGGGDSVGLTTFHHLAVACRKFVPQGKY